MYKRKTKTNEEFIEQAKLKHGDKYDYSKVEYINNKKKVLIGCRIHGFFEQRPSSHTFGYGCHDCLKENRNPYKGKEREYEKKLIELGSKIHKNKYDYSLVKYEHSTRKLKIICPIHGVFLQTAYQHCIRNNGCPKCVGKTRTNEEFIELCKKIHNNKYSYELCEYKNSNSLLKILCPKHGLFNQKATYHLSGSGCSRCKESKGEKKIIDILERNKINFITQKSFKGCLYRCKLFYDFYLPDYNLCIEFNGIQHYKPSDFFGGESEFYDRIRRDEIKKNFCYSNNISLLIIKYDDDIIEKLAKHIQLIDTQF